mgnify:FL=1
MRKVLKILNNPFDYFKRYSKVPFHIFGVKERACMRFVRKRFKEKQIIGAEVGVWRGENSYEILTRLSNCKLLYLIDPYEEYPAYEGTDIKALISAKAQAHIRLQSFEQKGRVVWLHKKFEGCEGVIAENSLDFVYIDGDHRYETVKKDLALALRLVKIGGVIGGHDYSNLPHLHGVKQAVNEFCKENEFKLNLGGPSDWWVLKS